MVFPRRGFAVFWILLTIIPSLAIFTGIITVYVNEMFNRNAIFNLLNGVRNFGAGANGLENLANNLQARYRARVRFHRINQNEVSFTMNLLGKDYPITVTREPRNAYIFFDASDYNAPTKQEHLNPEIWINPNTSGLFSSFLPITSHYSREVSGHFTNINLSFVRHWTGPEAFENIDYSLSSEMKRRLLAQLFKADNCDILCASRDDCHGYWHCFKCESIYSCFGFDSFRERQSCLRPLLRQCERNSQLGVTTFHGQHCSNPFFNALKIANTIIWDYYSLDQRGRITVRAGPIDLDNRPSWRVNENNTHLVFSYERVPNPLANASNTAIQNCTTTQRSAIDQDCILSLFYDSDRYIWDMRLGRYLPAIIYSSVFNRPYHFIPQPISERVMDSLNQNQRQNYAFGIRRLPEPSFSGSGNANLNENYISRLTVREAIWAQVVKQRPQRFERLIDAVIDDINDIRYPSNIPTDFFFIFGDFPWFDQPRDYSDVDCSREEVFGLYKVRRTFFRGPYPLPALLRPLVCSNVSFDSSSSVYFSHLRDQFDRLNRALRRRNHPTANLFFIVARSEGSYPSHSQNYHGSNWNCQNRACNPIRTEVRSMLNFLNQNARRWNRLSIHFAFINDPGSLAYELPILLLQKIEKSRLQVRVFGV